MTPTANVPTHGPRLRRRAALVTAAAAASVALAACTSGSPATDTTSSAGTQASSPANPIAGSTSGEASSAASTSSATSADTTASPATSAPATTEPAEIALADGLDVLWSVVPLPDGAYLFTERETARIYWLKPNADGTPADEPVLVGTIPGVKTDVGEGGLLGLAVPEDFEVNPVFYAYYTTANDNRVAAIPWEGDSIGTPVPILTRIPRAVNHNGGRIAFGPDGWLYVATGDAQEGSLSQNRQSLAGKILRITPEGDPAPGNPFGGSPVWSYGHRNVQGLDWDAKGRLWASEFGADEWDELNLVQAGKNYGWPEVEGKSDGSTPQFVDPVAVWRPVDSSPSGLQVGPDGAVYIAALRGESVWRVPVEADGSVGEPERYLQGTYGRIRDLLFVGDRVWVLTSNNGGDRIVSLPKAAVGVR